jgi:CheY-like chemotaxis protein
MSAGSEAIMRRVLVVDNEPTTRFAVAATLQQAGYETVEADNGLTALRVFGHDTDFAAIVSDIQMPHLDGLQLLEQMRSHYITIPMVIISAFPQQLMGFRAHGAVGYLRKPFTRHQLLNMVNTAAQMVAHPADEARTGLLV